MLSPIRFIIGIVFYFIEALLLLRFVLILLGANLANPFASWVLNASNTLLSPFANIFPKVNVGGFAIDFTVLFALIVYVLLGQLILRLLLYLDNDSGVKRRIP